MNDGLDPPFGHALTDLGCVGQIGLDERHLARNRITVSARQIVENHDLVAALEEMCDGHAPDGSAGNEDTHWTTSLEKIRFDAVQQTDFAGFSCSPTRTIPLRSSNGHGATL